MLVLHGWRLSVFLKRKSDVFFTETMTLHRFFLSEKWGLGDRMVIRDQALCHQLRKVLRRKNGDRIAVVSSGCERAALIEDLQKESVILALREEVVRATEPKRQVRVFQSLLQNNDRFEEVLRHGTELGATAFSPLRTERVVAFRGKSRERWRKIIQEAAEQSERMVLPVLEEEVDFAALCSAPQMEGVCRILLAAPSESDSEQAASWFDSICDVSDLSVAVGPEGGFSSGELSLARDAGFIFLNLGERVLRSETAALAFLAALNCCDLQQQKKE